MVDKVDLNLLKKLRAQTGAGLRECKQALLQGHNDIEAAALILEKLSEKKAAEKAHRETPEGGFFLECSPEGEKGILLEVKCETDFVSRDVAFQNQAMSWAKKVYDAVEVDSTLSLEKIRKLCERERLQLFQKVDENIQILSFYVARGKNLIYHLSRDGQVAAIASVTPISQEKGIDHQDLEMAIQQIACANEMLQWEDPKTPSEDKLCLFKDGSRILLESGLSHWQESEMLAVEGVSFRSWLDRVNIRITAFVCLSCKPSDKVKTFSADVGALLDRYR